MQEFYLYFLIWFGLGLVSINTLPAMQASRGQHTRLIFRHPATSDEVPEPPLPSQKSRGFGALPPPPTLDEYLQKQKATGARSKKKAAFRDLSKVAKGQASLHKMLGGGATDSFQEQKKQAW